VIPRQNIVHDIFSFVASGIASPRLVDECPELLSVYPATQAIQIARIQAIPQYRYNILVHLVFQSPRGSLVEIVWACMKKILSKFNHLFVVFHGYRHKKNVDFTSGQTTARRSKKARERVEKMKRMYGIDSPKQVIYM
jgi:hypothetical protein